jgi:drug/metabolite transporter (DMT)-like permease
MTETPSAATAVPQTGPDYLSYILLALLACSFGSTFLFQSIALRDLGPLETGSLRIIFGAAFLLPATFIAGQGLPRTAKLWSWATFNGLIGFFIPFNLTTWSLLYVPTSIAATIYSVIPLIILALSRLFLGVHISGRKWLGLLLGAVGLSILTLLGGSNSQPIQGDLLPKLAILISAVLIAVSGIAIRQMPKSPPLSAMAAALLIAAVSSAIAMAFTGFSDSISTQALVAIAAAGLFSTAIGQTIRFILLRRRGPVFVAPNAYLAAFAATVLGVLLLGEPVTLTLVVGFIVILVGLTIAQDGTGNMGQV